MYYHGRPIYTIPDYILVSGYSSANILYKIMQKNTLDDILEYILVLGYSSANILYKITQKNTLDDTY